MGKKDKIEINRNRLYISMAMTDLGGQMGQLPPLHDENSALALLFGKKSALILTQMHYFFSVSF